MSYYISKTIESDFETAIESITATLKEQGFGIVSDIDLSASVKKGLGKVVPSYRLLGACNPGYAYEAIMNEPQIGVLLPCGVAVRQLEDGQVSISVIDPFAAMMGVENNKLESFAKEVKGKLSAAIDAL